MAVISLTDTSLYNYPDLNIPSDKRGKFWNMKYGKAMFSEFMSRSNTGEWYHGRATYNENKLYAEGEQGYERYFNSFNHEGSRTPAGEARRPWHTLNLKPLRIGPKYFNIVHDKLDQVKFDAICTAIDTLSQDEKETFAASLRAKMDNRDFLQSLPIAADGISNDPEIPVDEDDYQSKIDQYKNESAINLENKTEKVLRYDNDYDTIDYEADENIMQTGLNLFHDYTRQGKHYIKRIDPGDGIIFPSRYSDFRDMRHGGYLDYLTIADLRAEIGKELDETQIASIASTTGWNGLTAFYGKQVDGTTYPYDSHRVTVLRYFFKCGDYLPGQKPAKEGKEVDPEKGTDKPSPELPEKGVYYQAWYEGNLILNTDFGYGCRKCYNQKRNWDNEADADSPLHAFKVNTVMASDIKAPIDHIMINWIALNDIIANAVPPGYAYDMGALQSIALGKVGPDGKVTNLTEKEIVKIHRATGDFFYNSTNMDGSKNQDRYGITKMDNGLPDDLVKRYNNIREGVALLESISISSVMAGNNPNPEMGKGTSEIALQADFSSMGYMYKVKHRRFEKLAKAIANRVRANETRRPVTGTFAANNTPDKKMVTVRPDMSLADRKFFFRIENRPTKEEWQDLYDKAQRSLDAKEITLADYIAVKAAENLKQAWVVFANRQKQNEKKMIAMQRENQQMTFEGQAAAAERAEAAKQQTLQVEHQFKMIEKDADFEKARILQQERIQGEYSIQQLIGSVRADVAQAQLNNRTMENLINKDHEAAMAEQEREIQQREIAATPAE